MLQVHLKKLFTGNFCNVRDFKFRGLISRSYTTEYMLVSLVDQFIEQALSWTNLRKSESINAQLLEEDYYLIIILYIVLNHISACIRY